MVTGPPFFAWELEWSTWLAYRACGASRASSGLLARLAVSPRPERRHLQALGPEPDPQQKCDIPYGDQDIQNRHVGIQPVDRADVEQVMDYGSLDSPLASLSGSTWVTDRSGTPRSRSRLSTPYRAAWSATGPVRIVSSPSVCRISRPANQVAPVHQPTIWAELENVDSVAMGCVDDDDCAHLFLEQGRKVILTQRFNCSILLSGCQDVLLAASGCYQGYVVPVLRKNQYTRLSHVSTSRTRVLLEKTSLSKWGQDETKISGDHRLGRLYT